MSNYEEHESVSSNESPLLCVRCLRLMKAGRGEFFVVQIRAVADPSPPDLDAYEEEGAESIQRAYEDLVDQLKDTSRTEANEQVARQMQIRLCNDCFPAWYENPA